MCFTPKVSFATAMIEFAIAAFLYLRYNKSMFSRFLSAFVFVLGFYQFTEYMFCTSGEIQLWGKLGFITYMQLPAIGLHFVLSYTKHKINKFLIYIPPIIFALIALAHPNFVIEGSCSKVFVSSKNYFYDLDNFIPAIFYTGYYFLYLSLSGGYLFQGIRKTSNKTLIIIYLILLSTILLTIVPPFLIFIVFPQIAYEFPSIYCQFGFLFSVIALIGAHLDERLRHRFRHLLQRISHKIHL